MTIVFIFDVVILAVQHIFTNIFAIASGIVISLMTPGLTGFKFQNL